MKTKKHNLSKADVDGIFGRMPAVPGDLVQQVEDALPQYIFYADADYNERWCMCSHCGHEFYEPTDKETQKNLQKFDKEVATGHHNYAVRCPICGCYAEMKADGKMKNRASLTETIRVIFFIRKSFREVYAKAAYVERDWKADRAPQVEYSWCGDYYFAEGLALQRNRYGELVQSVSKPFANYMYNKVSWFAVGLETLNDTYIDYWPHGEFYPESDACNSFYDPMRVSEDLIEYIAGFSEYPQCEKLTKVGLKRIAGDKVFLGNSHRECVNWRQTNIYKMLGLDRRELQEFADAGGDPELLHKYKQLKKYGINMSFQQAEQLYNFYILENMAIKLEVTPKRIWSYIKNVDLIVGCHMATGHADENQKLSEWRDYINAAEKLKMPLYRDDVKFPEDLLIAHNVANEELREKETAEERKRLEKLTANYQKLYKKLVKKYEFESGKYMMRVPDSANAIKSEGYLQHHCVGGYIERHMAEKTVILFMRRTAEPDKPLYTVEIDPENGSVRQFRGYKNAIPPKRAKAWLDAYAESLKPKQKRRKAG